MLTPPAPRLFVIPAREAPVAVVFRRGPTNWYHLLKWDTQHDELERGAWFRGRIYAEKCDISPDGKLLLYFAHKNRNLGTPYSDSWTAVSRLPWLTALALWPWNTTYGGGGHFVGNDHVILRRRRAVEAHPDHRPDGLKVEFGDAPGHASSGEIVGVDWCGRDFSGRLIYARRGCLFCRSDTGHRDRLIADLNDMKPDPLPAPSWASRGLHLHISKRRTSGSSSSGRDSARRAARRRST